MMHSLSVVHRDIKPDNILWSNSLEEFVFSDFGMTSLLKEKWNEATMTGFVGTPGYCSKEMERLMGGDKGYVNLYINDLVGLNATIKTLNSNKVKSTLIISRNSMSLEEYASSFMSGDN